MKFQHKKLEVKLLDNKEALLRESLNQLMKTKKTNQVKIHQLAQKMKKQILLSKIKINKKNLDFQLNQVNLKTHLKDQRVRQLSQKSKHLQTMAKWVPNHHRTANWIQEEAISKKMTTKVIKPLKLLSHQPEILETSTMRFLTWMILVLTTLISGTLMKS